MAPTKRWRQLSVNYQDTDGLLRRLLAEGGLFVDDLPPGRHSGLLDDGRIVVDRSLDGRWLTDPLQTPAARSLEARRRDVLEPVLFQGLARRFAPEGRRETA